MKFVVPVALAMLSPSLAFANSIAAPPELIAATSVPPALTLGPVRAGLLCLPKGSLHGRDFPKSREELTLLARQAYAELDAGTVAVFAAAGISRITLDLTAVKVRLCERSPGVWGIGGSKALSGDAMFTFRWSTGVDSHVAAIKITLAKNEALQIDEIVQLSMNRLLVDIAQASTKGADRTDAL